MACRKPWLNFLIGILGHQTETEPKYDDQVEYLQERKGWVRNQ